MDEKVRNRLWIGNIAPVATEFQLLKLLQKHGNLEKFDYLFHKSGKDAGQPRGYCFVTFKSVDEAERVKNKLDGLYFCGRKLIVKWAKNMVVHVEPKKVIDIPALSGVGKSSDKTSYPNKIAAIEAKLKLMENSSLDFEISPTITKSKAKRKTSCTDMKPAKAFIESKK